MASWAEVEAAEPDFARRVRERFDAHKHKVMATLRKDGAPRVSGIEVEFKDGQISMGMMPRSRKVLDLQRDPRLALHSGTEDPTQQAGEVIDAKISGRAVERAAEGHHSFTIDVTEVTLISIGHPTDHLVIEVWHPGSGLLSVKRY
jgi:hypothetical protein